MPFPSTNPSLERALVEKGYAEPTAVQAAVLQPEAEDRDLLVSAQTRMDTLEAPRKTFAINRDDNEQF